VERMQKRLVETIELVPGLDKLMAEFLSQQFPNETVVKNY